MPSAARNLANLLGGSATIPQEKLGSDISTIEQVATTAQLSDTGNSVGDQRVVGNNLFIWNGSGWFRIALINETPTWDSGGQPNGTYELDSNQNPTVITLAATDPDGLDINYSYVTSGQMDSMATISQDSSIFTITPVIQDSFNAGQDFTGSITFRASDGVNILPQVSSFTLSFTTREAWAPSGAEFNTSINVSTLSTNGGGPTINDAASLAFKPDGTRMFVLRATNISERVVQFDLSTAWDLSTASYAGDTGINQVPSNKSLGIHFKPDGTRFYSVSYASNRINLFYYNLSTAWDVSSHGVAGGNSNGSTSFSGLSLPRDLYIKPDGTKVYIVALDASAPGVWTLSTPWEFTGGVSIDTSTRNTVSGMDATSVTFKSDGTLMFILDKTDNRLVRYTLSTAWDPSSGTITDELDMSTLGITLGNSEWITFSEDGTRMYYTKDTSTVYEYLLE
jgi:hypothetical protein